MKSLKILKRVWPMALSGVLIAGSAVAGVYGTVHFTKAPLGIPFTEAIEYESSIPNSTNDIINQWNSRTTYEPKIYNNIEEIIEDNDIVVEEETNNDFYTKMNYIDKQSLEDYLNNNTEELNNGYEKIFIDKVDLLNTPTGIKTTLGHDILAVDSLNGIIIVGIDIPFDGGTSKAKLAIINNPSQLDMSLVKDLSYWENLESHVYETQAVLAINASNYTWNDIGDYGVLYGAIKYHGDIERKTVENSNVSGFSESGTLLVGDSIDNLYNAFETSPILIKNGEDVYTGSIEQNQITPRNALSAIGQTKDGKTLMLVASGGVYGSNLGVTPSELSEILKQYDAYNAVCLSGGSRTMMYWNGRYVTEAVGYSENGVRLPNAIVVKAGHTITE